MADVPLGLTNGSLASFGPATMVDIVVEARELGYASFWVIEAFGTDAMTILGAVSQRTEGMQLGTGIIPAQLRTPQLAAMSAATLQQLNPNADVLLGVGVSAPGILRLHGVEAADKPVRFMREYLTLLRECLSGESVTFEGDYFQVKRFRLGLRQGERRPKIVLAALNPRMLKLAGELADGVLFNYIPQAMVGPSIEAVREGGDATIYAYVHAAVTDFEPNVDSARRDIFNYAMADGYANMFRRAGFSDEVNELRERYAAGDREGSIAAVSDRMVQAIDFIGSESEVSDFVRGHVDAGIDHPVLMAMPWGDDRRLVVRKTMEAAASALS